MVANEKERTTEPWVIGGPGTRIPFMLESFFSWTVALSFLGVSGYHYVRTIYVLPALENLSKLLSGKANNNNNNNENQQLPCWLEITTSSRTEQSEGQADRYDQLVKYLQKTTEKMSSWTADELIVAIRRSSVARRLVSLVLAPSSSSNDPSSDINSNKPLLSQLKVIYPRLLELPEADAANGSSSPAYSFDISVILPAYRERGTDVRFKLERAYDACKDASRVEIIVVDAGECIDLEEQLLRSSPSLMVWGNSKVVSFLAGGGRGPCLNFGATHATGRHLSFLHADTTLPPEWDEKIVRALDYNNNDGTNNNNNTRANSCAFSFGIDTSAKGLNGGPFPPGIRAIETTANMRTQMYSLPYGDQCLSVPALVFDYLGGFPDQCLMEDYELISLLRRRAALLPKFGISQRERLVIIGGTPAYCSPRRWQKFGVLYVTFMNSRLVQAYASGKTPNWLFEKYYGRSPPERSSDRAPWELDLEELID